MPTFRSRRLPHYHCVGQATFLTWRLYGSLPQSRSFPSAIASGRAFLAMDRVLDTACNGPLFLRMPEIANMVMDAIYYDRLVRNDTEFERIDSLHREEPVNGRAGENTGRVSMVQRQAD